MASREESPRSLTNAQTEQLRERLGVLMANMAVCPACGSSTWAVSPNLFEMWEFTAGQSHPDRRVIPVVAVNCENCGFMVQFNAIAMGLMKSPRAGGGDG
jgi:hypothetical protein